MTNTIKLWIYPGANPNGNATAWGAYEAEVSQYVRRPGQDGGAAINYSWGKQNESTQADAGSMTLTLDNRDGRFSTDKIDGPWYGLLDINTPIRLGVVAAFDTFTRTVSGAAGPAVGWAASWLNSSAGAGTTTFSVDGSKGLINTTAAGTGAIAILGNSSARDMDITSVVVPVVTASGGSYGIGHVARYTTVDNFTYATTEFDVAGTVTIKIRKIYLGAVTVLASLTIPSSSYTAGQSWGMRTQMDGDTMRVKAWPSSGSEPAAWMLSADESDNTGTGVGIYASRFTGNSNGAVNFVALDSITVTGLEWTGYVYAWPVRWDITGRNSWTPIQAGGILRRLRQGTNPIQSPLRRQLGSTADVSGYWPLEEGADARYFLAVSPNTAPATFSDVTPGADSTLAGATIAPTLNSATSSITAQVRKVTFQTGSGMAAMMIFKIPTLPGSKTRIARIRAQGGAVSYWDYSVDATNSYVEAFGSDGTLLSSATNTQAFNFTGKWVAWQLETALSGSNTNWSAIYHEVAVNAPFYSQTGTVTAISAVANFPTLIQVTGIQGMAVSHIWLGKNTLPFVTSSFANVSAGWDGETAGARFARVCTEAGIPFTVAGPDSILSSTEKMGPQRESTSLGILQSCIDADYAVMTERGAGLEMIPRVTRWNLGQLMNLSKASNQIAEIPEPTRDDQRLRNQWSINRTNGGSATYQNQASIDRNGLWPDSATLNVFDDSVLNNHAAWRVSIGTSVRMRWPSISIDLARNPSLAEYWRKRYYGWRFGVTTAMSQVNGNEPDLIMEGYQASLTPDRWDIEMNATDARVWTAGVTDDTGIYGQADNEYCTTTALISATALSIPITTGQVQGINMPKWDNTAGLWSGGVAFNVGGEMVVVTSITNGAGQAQTLNVAARGAGGYAFSHASGTAVSLWNPALVAL